MTKELFQGFTENEMASIRDTLAYLYTFCDTEDFPTLAAAEVLLYLGCKDDHLHAERCSRSASHCTTKFSIKFLEDLYIHLNAIWWYVTPGKINDPLLDLLNWLEDKAEIPGDSPMHEANYLANKKEKEKVFKDLGEEFKYTGTRTPPTEALRHNEGKTPFAYLPMHCLEGAARVMQKGSLKYSKGNWLKGYEDLASPLSSLMRHVAALQEAFERDDKELGFDTESQEHHADHVITSAILLIQTLKLKGLYTK